MISYIGGKSIIGKWIRDYIPTDIETYVETFGGMFWVWFCMDNTWDFKKVVYNVEIRNWFCNTQILHRGGPIRQCSKYPHYRNSAMIGEYIFVRASCLSADYLIFLQSLLRSLLPRRCPN